VPVKVDGARLDHADSREDRGGDARREPPARHLWFEARVGAGSPNPLSAFEEQALVSFRAMLEAEDIMRASS